MWIDDIEQALKDIDACLHLRHSCCIDLVLPAIDGIVFKIGPDERIKWFSENHRVIKYNMCDWRDGKEPEYDSTR